MNRKLGAVRLLWGAATPSNTTSQDRQTGQRSDSIGRTVLQTVAQKTQNDGAKNRTFHSSLRQNMFKILKNTLYRPTLKHTGICRTCRPVTMYFIFMSCISRLAFAATPSPRVASHFVTAGFATRPILVMFRIDGPFEMPLLTFQIYLCCVKFSHFANSTLIGCHLFCACTWFLCYYGRPME